MRCERQSEAGANRPTRGLNREPEASAILAGADCRTVCAWIGNSAAVAQKHYLQVTEDRFAEATAGEPEGDGSGADKAAQIPAQSASEQACQGWTGEPADLRESPVFQSLSPQDHSWQDDRLPLVGLEPTTH